VGVGFGAGRGLAGVGAGGGVVATGVAATGTAAADGWATVVRALQPVTATAAANASMVMIRTGRIATSPKKHDP